jgi:hypothetical protein
MQEIGELRVLEGLREECDLLKAELESLRQEKQQEKQPQGISAQEEKRIRDECMQEVEQLREQVREQLAIKQRDYGQLQQLARRYKMESEKKDKQLEHYQRKYGDSGDDTVTDITSTTGQFPSPASPMVSTSVVTTSTPHTLTAEERANKFKADVAASLQKEDPNALKRRRMEGE